ncbi:MAG: protein-L-isoaspartate(D-aspartate) O-methyltransferase [Alphaproteobacteria bacterium]|nr:protein-L-isoaspartate(D-aspartate) O-methyltransferase [Alphaproteobacteria bacterium]MDD9920172.1 protein-L-isoaspartate(D-aspartate) O-methyltransferase [Alphaproteobacteria bacterium]
MTAFGQKDFRIQRMMDVLRQKNVASDTVLRAMELVPRHQFLSRAFSSDAYDDSALPIGENQTISQPSVVAQMTEALNLNKGHKVLEIGTGSGYQLAVLCQLARRVFSVERHRSLSERATTLLHDLGYHNFITVVGDGTLGWHQQAPFDRIIVTAAGPKIPPALLDQLAPEGILVIPVGAPGKSQQLIRCTKSLDGHIQQEILGPVVFVPLVGEQGVEERRSA